ncbi:hypothetical protein KY313_00040 [Candidatus Woesearchaeota archaeon]|jgi:hypothetical protein|nr:hypothetical protein [Candidatus Woesearchaeota archaeon]
MEKRWKGKPFFDEREEIQGQLNDLLGDVKTEVNGSLARPKNIDDFLIGSEYTVNVPEKEEQSVYYEPSERIKPSGLPPVKYLVSQKAFDEVNKLKDHYGWNNEEGLEETIFRFAIQDKKLNLIKGDLKEFSVYDSNLGDFVKTLDEVKYLISAKETDKDIKSLAPFKEVTMDSALPGDTIYIQDLDLATQKKINNWEYGAGSLNVFEPFNHEWENEHIRE